jgi:hypothetical protein
MAGVYYAAALLLASLFARLAAELVMINYTFLIFELIC